MASNEAPHFPANGVVGSTYSTAANTSSSGTGTIGTDIWKIITGGTNGTWVDVVRIMAQSTAPASTTATMGRIFVSSVTSGATTAANTFLIEEVILPIVAAASATIAQNAYDVKIGFRLPPNYTLLFTTHDAPATTTSWRATALGAGDY